MVVKVLLGVEVMEKESKEICNVTITTCLVTLNKNAY